MDVLVLGAGMMGRAIAFDLAVFSKFDKVTLTDRDKGVLSDAERFLNKKDIYLDILNLDDGEKVKDYFQKNNVVISAVPYNYNYALAKTAVDTNTHFLDLGGNNNVVEEEKKLFKKAKKNNVTIIPDCGLAPGMVSIITKDIVENLDQIKSVKLRVGGLPQNPKPPLNYQIVFSPNGLINEYIEDALILENRKIVKKKSMNDVETIVFPKPFKKMEAFITSGGCSSLPFTYKDIIDYLDYKTIRYTGHCETFKSLLDFKDPREILIDKLLKLVPTTGKDVVLLKVYGKGIKNSKETNIEYTMIDYYDEKNNITSMMRTTAFPVSIIAEMIRDRVISDSGVFTCEEIVPCKSFFDELKKRNIKIIKETT